MNKQEALDKVGYIIKKDFASRIERLILNSKVFNNNGDSKELDIARDNIDRVYSAVSDKFILLIKNETFLNFLIEVVEKTISGEGDLNNHHNTIIINSGFNSVERETIEQLENRVSKKTKFGKFITGNLYNSVFRFIRDLEHNEEYANEFLNALNILKATVQEEQLTSALGVTDKGGVKRRRGLI